MRQWPVKAFILAWVLCYGCAVKPSTAPAAGDVKLIVNAVLISPERRAPLPNAWVRIEGERIAAVGTGRAARRGVKVIDAQGGYLIPGLIDSHVHLYHATGLKRRYTQNYDALYAAYMEQQPRSFLFHGFTTVIELNADAATNTRFNTSPLKPRLFDCGQGVVLFEGFMALEVPEGRLSEFYPGFLIDSYADGVVPPGADPAQHTPRAVVEHVRKNGGRCIKIYYEEALWWPGAEKPDFMLPSVEIVKDVVAAASAYDIPVLLHATTPNGHRFGVEAGVDIFAHGMWEWPDQAFDAPYPLAEYTNIADAVAEKAIGLQSTVGSIRNTASLFAPEILTDPGWADVVPEDYIEYLKTDGQAQRDIFLKMFGPLLDEDASPTEIARLQKAFRERYERLIESMVKKGATLLFGTDTAVGGFGWGSPPGLSGYWEIQSYVNGGVALPVILEALTLNNAKAFGLDGDLGSIEPGKIADLLILRSNPLQSATAYNDIDRIILNGDVIERDWLSARYPLPRQ